MSHAKELDIRRRVLLVDDDRSTCEMLEAGLRRRGFETEWRTSGEECRTGIVEGDDRGSGAELIESRPAGEGELDAGGATTDDNDLERLGTRGAGQRLKGRGGGDSLIDGLAAVRVGRDTGQLVTPPAAPDRHRGDIVGARAPIVQLDQAG